MLEVEARGRFLVRNFGYRSEAGGDGAIWWRVEHDDAGRQMSVRSRAVDEYDATPEVPRERRDPRLCPACELDIAHTGAFHRQYVPFHPDLWSRLLGHEATDTLAESLLEEPTAAR